MWIYKWIGFRGGKSAARGVEQTTENTNIVCSFVELLAGWLVALLKSPLWPKGCYQPAGSLQAFFKLQLRVAESLQLPQAHTHKGPPEVRWAICSACFCVLVCMCTAGGNIYYALDSGSSSMLKLRLRLYLVCILLSVFKWFACTQLTWTIFEKGPHRDIVIHIKECVACRLVTSLQSEYKVST